MAGLYTLIAFAVGFLVAQIAKVLIALAKSHAKMSGKEIAALLLRSGGMPSGHSASFTAATVYLGCSQGFTSPIFALAVCMTVIIVYDAVNVRYAVGEQGKILMELSDKEKTKQKVGRLVEGHTVAQAVVGILIGVLVGLSVFGIFG